MTAPKVTHETSIVLSPSSSPKISSNELRWLGEEADGKRNGDYVVVWRKKDGKNVLSLELISDTMDATQIAADFVVRTNTQGDGLRGEKPMTIMWNDKAHVIYRTNARGEKEYPDAIFWSQSAFLKFVIPYYARMRTTGHLDAMRRKYFRDKKCLAVMHFEPSEDEMFAPDAGFRGICEGANGELTLMSKITPEEFKALKDLNDEEAV